MGSMHAFQYCFLKIISIIIFNLRTAAFKAYCAIWVRRSNFRHQASARVSPCDTNPSEGRSDEDFFALKIRRLRLGANPRTWLPKASTLHLDDRSHFLKIRLQLILFSTPRSSKWPVSLTFCHHSMEKSKVKGTAVIHSLSDNRIYLTL
jgi:hypothetical protein